MQKVVNIDGVGNVLFRRQRRFVRMSMRVSQEGDVIVNVPILVSYKTAKEWVYSKSVWINKSKNKLHEQSSKQTVFQLGSVYKTYRHTLCIVHGKSSSNGEQINIGVPHTISASDFKHTNVQTSIRSIIDKVYTREAKEVLPVRVCHLADKHGFQFNKLSFRNNKSRWGSCSGINNISLNIHLMRLPDHLIDYVILHELCHIEEKNHSQSFWDLLESVCPDSKQLRKELRNYSTTIY